MTPSIMRQEGENNPTYPFPYFLHEVFGDSMVLESDKTVLLEGVNELFGSSSSLVRIPMKEETEVNQRELQGSHAG